jgi:DNA-3-methyladenine glycosylase
VLCSGPGRLAAALGITGALDGHCLDRTPLWLSAAQPLSPDQIVAGPRVGITRAAEWPLRFWQKGSRWVSR